MTWEQAMVALDFAQLRGFPVEVKALDEDRTRWMVVLGGLNVPRGGHSLPPGHRNARWWDEL